MILLQIGKPNAENGELLYRCELTTVDNVRIVTRTEWNDDGTTTVTTRPATDYEVSLLAEPDCPLVD